MKGEAVAGALDHPVYGVGKAWDLYSPAGDVGWTRGFAVLQGKISGILDVFQGFLRGRAAKGPVRRLAYMFFNIDGAEPGIQQQSPIDSTQSAESFS